MNLKLRFTRPLLYLLAPVLIVMVFVGFPPPFAPPHRTRPGQEQSEIVTQRALQDVRGHP